MNHTIDCYSNFKEGGYCQFYCIKDHPNLGFKEFKSKKHAKDAFYIQKQLSIFDLSPKVHSNICKLTFACKDSDISGMTQWGYITEIAKEINYTEDTRTLAEIQILVDSIFDTTKLKFWDCHFSNIGLIKRNGANKIVCIDTGKESFDGYANAWGLSNPGPKCEYCDNYFCNCIEE